MIAKITRIAFDWGDEYELKLPMYLFTTTESSNVLCLCGCVDLKIKLGCTFAYFYHLTTLTKCAILTSNYG